MKKIVFLFALAFVLMSTSKSEVIENHSPLPTAYCNFTVYIDGEQGPTFTGLSIFNDALGVAQACDRAKKKAQAWIDAQNEPTESEN